MSILPHSAIKAIAKEIATGNTCYVHRYTAEITTFDPSIEDAEQVVAQQKIEAELEERIESYVKLEALSKKARLSIMKDFLEELPDKSVRKQLSNALNRKNPIRNFNQAVTGDIGLHQHWKNFNFEEYQRWVANVFIDAYNY